MYLTHRHMWITFDQIFCFVFSSEICFLDLLGSATSFSGGHQLLVSPLRDLGGDRKLVVIIVSGLHMIFLILRFALVFGELDCSKHLIFHSRISPSEGGPPRNIPSHLLAHYTRCGQIAIEHMYVDDTNKGVGLHYNYSRSSIDRMIATAHKWRNAVERIPRLPDKWLFQALEHNSIRGLDVLVVGSVEPWAEAVAVAFGAASVTTVDYNRITYQHPLMTTIQPDNQADYENNSHKKFGAIISLSSLDHDGLGRYGDPLCPDGDLLSMISLRQQLKEEGLLFLSVPIGPDVLVWNLHRRYGPIRLPLLLNGYDKKACFGWDEALLTAPRSFRKSYEPVFVLQTKKIESMSESETYKIDL